MLYQIPKYIGTTLFITTIPIVFLVLGVDFLFAFIHELGGVGQGHFTTWNAFVYVVGTLPRRLYELFPMTSLVGVLLGLGLLASHSELIVMRSSGISILRISFIVFQWALVLAVLMGLMGEFIVPKTEYWADAYKVRARSGGQAVLTVQGTWVRDENHFIHIAKIKGDAHMQDITDYEFDENLSLKSVTFIKDAVYQDNHWQFNDINKTTMGRAKLTTASIAQTTQEKWIDPHILNVALVDPDDLSMRGLWQYADYLQGNGLDNKPYLLNFWKKALQPLAIIVMMLLSVPFIFGPLRSASMGLRLLAGIIMGFSFYVLSEVFGPLALVYQWPPLLAALAPIIIFGAIAIALGTRKNI
ncbi:MAG: LPS export ABC transporter permease LptG [Gammaproteobacteria bacterium]|jgi:lipopolysaccharide export system permease protein